MKLPLRKLLPLALITILQVPITLHGETQSAYLFAHMTKDDYGRLYYSVSEDGLTWRQINDGKRVHPTFRGHPEICKGPDGNYWLVGVAEEDPYGVILYKSKDLVSWEPQPLIPAEMLDAEDRKAGRPSLGAPKLFYDDDSELFYMTWHARLPGLDPEVIHGVNEARWYSMRTFVMTSADLREWSKAKRLFQYDLATIDVIIRKDGERYYAIIKDERYPTYDWPTGKSIRIASSDSPTGPWTEPGPPITPNYHEAPTVFPIADGSGWYMYHEQYPGIQYGLSTAKTLAGPWYNMWIQTYSVPEVARHGCMITITPDELKSILNAFDQ